MKIPAEFKPSYWAHVAGVVATFAIGFVWGGWVNGRTAEARVVDGAGPAAVADRAPSPKKQK
jgi:hypothetical protein